MGADLPLDDTEDTSTGLGNGTSRVSGLMLRWSWSTEQPFPSPRITTNTTGGTRLHSGTIPSRRCGASAVQCSSSLRKEMVWLRQIARRLNSWRSGSAHHSEPAGSTTLASAGSLRQRTGIFHSELTLHDRSGTQHRAIEPRPLEIRSRVTRCPMVGGELPQLRYLLIAAIERKRTASVKTASGRRVGRRTMASSPARP